MVRKILIALVILAAIGGGAYFILGKDKIASQVAALESAPSGSAAATASAANATPPAPGEFWTKRCEEKGNKYCEIFQRLMIKENNQRLIEFAVGYPEEMKGTAQAAIILPLGVMVSEGISLKVDDQAPAKAAYRVCVPDGCLVVMNLPETFLSLMKSGKVITVSFLDGAGKQVNVEMSLEGFGKNLDEVKG